jgi:hypothetical protein
LVEIRFQPRRKKPKPSAADKAEPGYSPLRAAKLFWATQRGGTWKPKPASHREHQRMQQTIERLLTIAETKCTHCLWTGRWRQRAAAHWNRWEWHVCTVCGRRQKIIILPDMEEPRK